MKRPKSRKTMDTEEAEADQENNGHGRRLRLQPQRRTIIERKLVYRDLMQQIEDIHEADEFGIETAKTAGKILKEANELEVEWPFKERVERIEDTLIDASVVASAGSILVKCIESINMFARSYEPSQFANEIKKYCNYREENDPEPTDPEVFDLIGLLQDSRAIIPEVPTYNYVYGAYELGKVPEPKVKKTVVRQKAEKQQKKQPEKIKEDENDESNINKIVKVLYTVLTEEYARNGHKPIKYYDYVIDTDHFSNTIENMFYFSFLIRDGKAEIDLDNNGVAYISPVRSKKLAEMREAGGINSQIITSFSIDEWKRFKKPGLIQKHIKKE